MCLFISYLSHPLLIIINFFIIYYTTYQLLRPFIASFGAEQAKQYFFIVIQLLPQTILINVYELMCSKVSWDIVEILQLYNCAEWEIVYVKKMF